MFRVLRAIFRLNVGGCIYILQCRKRRDLVFYGIAIYIHPPKFSLKMDVKFDVCVAVHL